MEMYFNLIFTFITTTSHVVEKNWLEFPHLQLIGMIMGLHG